MSGRVKATAKVSKPKRRKFVPQTRKANLSQSRSSPIDHIISLQKTIGNQAVQRLFKSGILQAKLKIGQPGNIHELETDQVIRMPEPAIQPKYPRAACGSLRENEKSMNTKPPNVSIAALVRSQEKENEGIHSGEVFENSAYKIRIDGPFRLILPKRSPQDTYRVESSADLSSASYKWKIKSGKEVLEIISNNSAKEVRVRGLKNGDAVLKVTIFLNSKTLGASLPIQVTSPTNLFGFTRKVETYSGPDFYGYLRLENYQLTDHNFRALTANNVRITEDMDIQNKVAEDDKSVSVRMQGSTIGKFSKSNFIFATCLTNSLGKFDDRLRIKGESPLPKEMKIVINQTMRADSLVVRTNRLTYWKDKVDIEEIKKQ